MSKDTAQIVGTGDDRRRWWIFAVLCLGLMLIAINTTGVNVALPSIRADLHFSEASLVWVVSAYLSTFGGCLLVGGRLGDIFGGRRVYLLGIMIFTLASLGCGLAMSQGFLVAARAAQGLAGAVVSAVALSQIVNLFTEAAKRAKALGTCAFVGASGGSIGLMLGGTLTSALDWRWIFFVNVFIGTGVYALGCIVLPRDSGQPERARLDLAGAVVATAALMLTLYAVMNGNQAGWTSAQTLTLFTGAGTLLMLLVAVEGRVQASLIPREVFRIHNVVVANIAGALLAAAALAWNFVSALYLQLVLQFSPLQVALVFLPANLIIAMMSLTVAPVLVIRFGAKRPLVIGMLILGGGLVILSRVSVGANLLFDVLPCMLMVGLGTGMAYNPLLLSALSGVAPHDSGVASGIVNTSFTMGGALGLSVLASIAAARTDYLLLSGADFPHALTGGYQVAYCTGAFFAIAAALICGISLRAGTADVAEV